ncbi:biopolymer transporter ExbD [Phormidium willei BDU 130791]|nr:biopolymer transporter ExbD [Phormidium willei BDU 130791]
MKNRERPSRIPTVNLVPMIDVLMSVLTFFVILAMSLTGQVIEDLELPEVSRSPSQPEEPANDVNNLPPTFEAGLNRNGELLIETTVVEEEEFLQAIAQFLETHPDGEVRLNAHGQLNYPQVDQVLSQMVEIGGDRVLLVLQESE